MTAEYFYELLAKKLCGEATLEQLAELDTLIEHHSEWQKSAEIFSALWQQSFPRDEGEGRELFDRHLQRMKKAGIDFEKHQGYIRKESRSSFRAPKWVLIAATGMAATLLLFFLFKNSIPASGAVDKKLAVTEVKTRPASRTQMHLPDGSTVWLNASSSLTYAKDFGKDLREVNLVGEAFFDVIKDPAHPFIIHTKVVDVRVTGTAFNVKAYPEDKTTETSLIRGSVELTVKNKDRDKYVLKPNEKVVVWNDVLTEPVETKTDIPKISFSAEHLSYATDSTVIETSWVENKLIFQQKETFKEVAVKMERWFGVRIIFTNEGVANLRPFGSFTTETITQALDALKEVTQFNYQIVGNEIIISP